MMLTTDSNTKFNPFNIAPKEGKQPKAKPAKKKKSLGGMNGVEVKDFVKKRVEFHRSAKNGKTRWINHARKSLNYYENAQRPPEIRDDRDVLYITMNMIRSKIDTKIGILTSAKPKPSITPRGMEDEDVAQAYREIFEYSMEDRNTKFHIRTQDAVSDMVKIGLGVLREEIDFSEVQDTLLGEMAGELSLSKRDPLTYSIDPANRSADMWGEKGATYYTIEDSIPIEELLIMYDEHKTELISLVSKKSEGMAKEQTTLSRDSDYNRDIQLDEGDDDSGSITRREFSEDVVDVVEHWYLQRVPVRRIFAVGENGTWMLAENPDGSLMEPEDIPEGAEDDYEVLTRVENRIRTCSIAGDKVLLYDRPSPYKHGRWPDTFVCGTMHHDQPMPYGEIHRLIDAQDLYNKLNSLVMDNAIRSNNAGWVYEDGALDEDMEQELEEHGSDAGLILRTRRGHMARVQRLQPASIPEGLYRLQNDLRVLFDELSNLYQTQRGGMPYDTSGKAIIALQQAGDTALTELQRNIEEALTDWGRKRLSNIQQFYTLERAWRVSDGMRDYDSILYTELQFDPEKQDTSLHLFRLEDGNEEPIPLLSDFSATHFDVRLAIGTGHERSREQRLEEARAVVELTGSVPSAIRNMLQALDIENRAEILREMSEKDQIMGMMQSFEEQGIDPSIIQTMAGAMGDPVMRAIIETMISDPQLAMKVASESPSMMQIMQQMQVDGSGAPIPQEEGAPMQGAPPPEQGMPMQGNPAQGGQETMMRGAPREMVA